MKNRNKLIAGFACLIGVSSILGVISFIQFSDLDREYKDLYLM